MNYELCTPYCEALWSMKGGTEKYFNIALTYRRVHAIGHPSSITNHDIDAICIWSLIWGGNRNSTSAYRYLHQNVFLLTPCLTVDPILFSYFQVWGARIPKAAHKSFYNPGSEMCVPGAVVWRPSCHSSLMIYYRGDFESGTLGQNYQYLHDPIELDYGEHISL